MHLFNGLEPLFEHALQRSIGTPHTTFATYSQHGFYEDHETNLVCWDRSEHVARHVLADDLNPSSSLNLLVLETTGHPGNLPLLPLPFALLSAAG